MRTKGIKSVQIRILNCIIIFAVLIGTAKQQQLTKFDVPGLGLQYQVQKGQNIYNLTSMYFSSPQFIQIEPFLNKVSNKTKPLCELQVYSQSVMSNQTIGYYERIRVNWSKYFQPIYEFEEIQNYKTVLDSIEFKGFFVILFQFGEFSYFKLQKALNKYKINETYTGKVKNSNGYISEGNFVIVSNQLIYFSQKQAIRFYENGTTKILQEYVPIGKQFEVAKEYDGDCVVIATGERGVSHYIVIDEKLEYLGQTKVIAMKRDQTIIERHQLQITDIEFDQRDKMMYLLDPEQGLFKGYFDMAQPNQTEIIVQATTINADLCENLQLSGDQLFMTCPNLIIYDVKSGNFKQNPTRLEFIPNQIIKNQTSGRLILFGDYSFGYFDDLDGQFAFGRVYDQVSKAFIYEDSFVMFNDFYVFVGKIIPQISNLHCFGDPNMVGVNVGRMNVQGNCASYNPATFQIAGEQGVNLNHETNQMNRQRPSIPKTGMCQVSIPISMRINDNGSFVLLAFEIIGILVVCWLGIAGSIYLCVKHIKVRKDYQILEEQATEIRSNIHQNKSQQMVEKHKSPTESN